MPPFKIVLKSKFAGHMIMRLSPHKITLHTRLHLSGTPRCVEALIVFKYAFPRAHTYTAFMRCVTAVVSRHLCIYGVCVSFPDTV